MDNTQYIDSFINENLSVNELAVFLDKRRLDKEFDLEVRAHLKLIGFLGRESIKNQLTEIQNSIFHDKTSLIDSYINGTLEQDVHNYIESRMVVDNEFRLDVKVQKQLTVQLERDSIKDQFKKLQEVVDLKITPPGDIAVLESDAPGQLATEIRPRKSKVIKLFVIYSSIAALLAIAFFVLPNLFKSDPELLFVQNIYVPSSSAALGFAGTDSVVVNISVYHEKIKNAEYLFHEDQLNIYLPVKIKIAKESPIMLHFNASENIPYMLEFNEAIYYIDLTQNRKRLKESMK